jgi:ABC-type Mn2+/Zn2+ transport system ATPase subunit
MLSESFTGEHLKAQERRSRACGHSSAAGNKSLHQAAAESQSILRAWGSGGSHSAGRACGTIAQPPDTVRMGTSPSTPGQFPMTADANLTGPDFSRNDGLLPAIAQDAATGEVLIDGKPVAITGPSVAKRKEIGMALIPEDRKTEGLMLPMAVCHNLSFAALDRLSTAGIIDRPSEWKAIEEMIQLLAIRTDGVDKPVGSLSGGNQQKVVIAKWLMVTPRIILLNDPTRGIDVGTKQEIYQLLRKLAASGAAIIFYSTDYDELIGCCDRVLVLYDGAVKRTLVGDEITQRALVASALNIATDRGGADVTSAVNA